MKKDRYSLFSSFKKFKDLVVVMSLRRDGNMKVHRKIDQDSHQSRIIDKKAIANRGCFLSGMGIENSGVVSVKSVHGNKVRIVSKSDGGRFIDNTDGLITAGIKGLFLSITVADCLPVVIFEPGQRIICLLHCGWKGLEKGIIKKALNEIKDRFGIVQEDVSSLLHAGIGPGIGACHFEVDKDFLPKFKKYPEAVIRIKEKKQVADALQKSISKERYFMDLKLIAKKQLQDCGISPEKIKTNPDCTFCKSDIFFSYRKDKKRPVDAMMVVVGWK